MFRVFVFLYCFVLVSPEPECSRFHYEEQTLRKMIMVEMLVEKFKTELGETIKSVNDALVELKAERTLSRNEFTELRSKLDRDMKRSILQANETVSDALIELKAQTELSKQTLDEIQTSVKTDMEQNVKKINERKDALADSIMFSARNIKNHSPSIGEIMVFQTIISSKGSGYDVTTGVFTAPVQGVYIFTLQLLIKDKKYIYFEILADNIPLLKGRFMDEYSHWYTFAGTSVPAFLTAGTRVWVKTGSVSPEALYEDGHIWNVFSGVLVHK